MIPVISKSRGFKSRDFPDETWLKKHVSVSECNRCKVLIL